MSGPEDAAETQIQSYVNGTTVGNAGTVLITPHFYAQGPTPKPTMTQVLAQVANHDWTTNLTYAAGKLRLDETNINYNGGSQGVTDRMVAATWMSQLQSTLAKLGWVGVSQQDVLLPGSNYGHVGFYNAFTQANCPNSGWCPTPIFYAMYLFSKIEGQQIVANTVSGLSANVQTISTKSASGNANILITNGNQSNYAQVTPDQSSAWTTANLLMLTADSCTETNPKLNGYEIGEGGSWAGSVTTITRGSSITIPPCGVALVQIQP